MQFTNLQILEKFSHLKTFNLVNWLTNYFTSFSSKVLMKYIFLSINKLINNPRPDAKIKLKFDFGDFFSSTFSLSRKKKQKKVFFHFLSYI